MPGKSRSPLFKDSEAAHYIGMSESWLRQSRMRGNPEAPPYIKIGKAVRKVVDVMPFSSLPARMRRTG